MKKKVLLMMIMVTMLLGVAGCGNNDDMDLDNNFDTPVTTPNINKDDDMNNNDTDQDNQDNQVNQEDVDEDYPEP